MIIIIKVYASHGSVPDTLHTDSDNMGFSLNADEDNIYAHSPNFISVGVICYDVIGFMILLLAHIISYGILAPTKPALKHYHNNLCYLLS